MPPRHLRIATRKSPLALWQANFVGASLISFWPDLTIELVPMLTSGDRFLKDKLLVVGGKGLFVKELEEALLKQEADIAVHSIKDVPAFIPPDLCLATICRRHSPFDALLSVDGHNIDTLPHQAIIGTSSLRRQTQLLAIRPDLRVQPLRGNIQTRINKLKTGQFDAIILAHAGLERLEITQMVSQIFSPELMLPACGQGALGIECREQDTQVLELLAPLHDSISAQCVQSERLVNALLGGNCHVPLAVYCELIEQNQVQIRAKVATPDGTITLTDRQQGHFDNALTMAEACANALLAQGAKDLLTLP